MKITGRDRILLLIYGLAALAIMTAIFCFSQQEGAESYELSKTVLDGIKEHGLDIFTPVIAIDGKAAGDGGFSFRLEGRKWAHFYLFALLGIAEFLWWRKLVGLKVRLGGPLGRTLAAAGSAFVFCLLYACADEFHQHFIDSRAGRPGDVIYDSLGFGISILIALAVTGLAALAAGLVRRRRVNTARR